MRYLNERASKILTWTSNLTHLVISLALVAATLLVTVFFIHEIYLAISVHTLIKGFLHALGTLLLLWTIVELVNTEIRFLKGSRIDIAVFIEVALVVVVREVIMLPVEEIPPTWIDLGMWVGSAALLGLAYLFVRLGQSYHVVSTDSE